MATIIQTRRGTAATWTSVNPVLADGEAGLETDTGKLKYGNGVTPWTGLPYSAQGESNTSSNSGAGAGLAQPKVGVNLPFKSLVAGANVTITPGADTVTIAAASGSGEVNTSSNLPGGQGLAAPKVGVDLPFKSLVAGTNVTLTPATNTITINASGGAQENPPFFGKPEGEPVILVLTGQSNALGANAVPPVTFPVNNQVFQWTTGGSGSVYSWQVVNLNAPQQPDYDGNFAYVGLPLGGRGNIAWSAANLIQKATGRPVYIISVAMNSQGIQEWYPGAPMNVLLNSSVPPAVAAVPGGAATIDGYIWMQGEANLAWNPPLFLPPKEYAEAFLDLVIANAEAQAWWLRRNTQVSICEISEAWGIQSLSYFWEIQYRANEFYRVASSYKLPTVEGIHFIPQSLADLGVIVGEGLMAGPIQKLKNPIAYLNDLYDVTITTPLTGQVPTYDATTGEWLNKYPPVSPVGGVTLNMRFDSNTNTGVDPGSGDVRVNNASPLLATQIASSVFTRPGNNATIVWEQVQIGDFIGLWENTGDRSGVTYRVTSTPVINTTWVQFSGQALLNEGTPTFNNNGDLSLFFIPNPARYLPAGGTDGQVLTKVSADNYDVAWDDIPPSGVQSVVAGINVTVDNTDPANPIVSAAGGGGVTSFNARTGVVVPIVGDYSSFYAPIAHVGATGAAHGVATVSVNGFMASTDKSKLDGIAAGAQSNHGGLTGLAADDHPQYLNTTRGDARYPLRDSNFTTFAVVSALPGSPNPNTIYFVTG